MRTTLVEVVVRVDMRRLTLIALVLMVGLSGCNALGFQQSSSSTITQSASKIQTQTVAAMNATETYHIDVNQTIRVSRTTKRVVNFTGEKQMTNYTVYQLINISVDGVVNRQAHEAHTNINQSTLGRTATFDHYFVNRTLYRRSPSYTRLYDSQWVKVNVTQFSHIWHRFNVLTRQRKILNASDVTLNGTETINGIQTYRLEVHPNPTQVKDIIFGLGRRGGLDITNITATYWIHKETMRPVRMTYELSGTRTIQGQEYDIESQIDLRISQYNDSVSIELPSKAETAVPIDGDTTERQPRNKNTI